MKKIATEYAALDKKLRRLSSLSETWIETDQKMKRLNEKISGFTKLELKKLNKELISFKLKICQ